MKHDPTEAQAVEAATPARADAAGWAHAPERSNMFALRFIVWIALTFGRRAARLILHPIALYFLLCAPTPRRHIKRYLFRAIGPRAGWGDGYRLLYAFASTVLDRIYFLRGRMDLFDVRVSGCAPVEAEVHAGRGAFMLGAHVGSFEAMGACRPQQAEDALRLAMLMFTGNAQRIMAILDAIALPALRPHIIALGRPHAMLELRDWLDGGGLGGLLADRTLPGNEDQPAQQRGNNVVLPFLGHPAVFNDGPFRLAALLRRRVFFMAGLYAGGARYDVRFEPLADFSERLADPAARERRIQQAIEAYVARLEALCREYPYNWFNFHDFWLEDTP